MKRIYKKPEFDVLKIDLIDDVLLSSTNPEETIHTDPVATVVDDPFADF